ncbi:hypothetical protein AVEN_14854-1 [Araneus ventricosus]|uniref:Uncharacterized protein n=1 Tax=Araneus ventricosus TaxID=182803 RepID=A0A4Y2TS97_ARAVE|nr:hypothetical protein AVEN_14854-1 [Araneus ventricosus]
MGLGMNKNNIDELEVGHSQWLTTEELREFHCASQKEVVDEALLEEEEEVTAKQQSFGAIREMLKAWETVISYIEKHHSNKEMAMRTTNLLNEIAVSRFRQILKLHKKHMSLGSFLVKRD